jgi:hypothetical protein
LIGILFHRRKSLQYRNKILFCYINIRLIVSPHVLKYKDGKASFEFYNADAPGTYRMVVEGIDEEGKLGRQVYRHQAE